PTYFCIYYICSDHLLSLHSFPTRRSSDLETLLAMLDDFRIVQQDADLPKPVWDYIRKEKFLAMIIGKEYGGLDFSPAANSHIVSRIATRSISAAVSVMVPNSLGPGELLRSEERRVGKEGS